MGTVALVPTSSRSQPVLAGVVAGLVGFTSAFVIGLEGLRAVGASPDQAASGLLAVSVAMGVASIVLAVHTRLPISIVWSTPGAALLASTGAVDGGWPAAIGAFLVTGVLILLTGLLPFLGALIGRIPPSIAQAMLAGILFQLCLGPVLALAENPLAVAPVVVVWLAAMRLAPRWSAPLAFLAAAVVITIHVLRTGADVDPATLVPTVEIVAPTFTLGAIVGIAVPLYLVTMASQNVPGVAVLRGYGYEAPWGRTMLATGLGTLLSAPAGGQAINLAAMTATLVAGPEAGEDRSRRWVSAATAGAVLTVLGIFSAAFAGMVLAAPPGVVAAVAGLALFMPFAGAMKAALADAGEQLPATVTFLVAASGLAIAGVSAAFWALVAGTVTRAVLHAGRRATP